MSFNNPTKSVSQPSNAYLKLDSRHPANKMQVVLKQEEGDPIKAEVEKVHFVVLDEDFMTVTGQVPHGGYIRCNTVHRMGNQKLVVSEMDDNGSATKRTIATGKWKQIEEAVKRSGGRNTKQVFALLVAVDGPESQELATVKKEIAGLGTIIRIDIKGMWWQARGDFNKRLRIKNWDRMYISFSEPLVAYEHKYGKAHLPTIAGRQVDPEKDAKVFEACKRIDAEEMSTYRKYIQGAVPAQEQAGLADYEVDLGGYDEEDAPFSGTPQFAAPSSGFENASTGIDEHGQGEDDLPF